MLMDFAIPKCDFESMLLVRTLTGFIFLFLILASVLFGSSGTLNYRQAWETLAMFFGCAAIITIWLWCRDQALLERRVKAGPGSERDPIQNIVQSLAGLVFIATFAVSGLDRRFGWSHVPDAVSLAGDAMIVIGFLIVFLTFRENTYTAGTIEIAQGLIVPALAWRLLREEIFLAANLSGYDAYRGRVRYRLVPMFW